MSCTQQQAPIKSGYYGPYVCWRHIFTMLIIKTIMGPLAWRKEMTYSL